MDAPGYPIQCRDCRYDRSGLPLSSPCPECGSQRLRVLNGKLEWHPRWLLTMAVFISPTWIVMMHLDWAFNQNRTPDPLDAIGWIFFFMITLGCFGVTALDICAALTYARRERPILATHIYNVISILWVLGMIAMTVDILRSP